MPKRIFLSYRREDSAGQAGRVSDRLVQEFGKGCLFVDVDGIPLGVDFVKRLTLEVASCDALLAVVGPRWLDLRDEHNERRIDNPNDFVRVEIGAALQRDIPVIPILVEGAKVPRADFLPEDIRGLSVRNGLDVRHASFHADMDRLVRELKTTLFDVGASRSISAQQRASASPRQKPSVEITFGPGLKWAVILPVLVAAVSIFWVMNWPPFLSDNASTRHLPTDTSVASKKSTPSSITGDWPFKQTSDVDHQEHLGIMSLTVDGEKVSGMMTTWDGTKSKVDGTFVKDRLSLTRKTEMDALQVIDMKMINPKLFSGSYRNEGQVQDSGKFEMQLNTTQR